MLSKEKRLNLKHSFTFVVKGQKFENDILRIFWREGGNSQPLVGIALKKESLKLAVERNQARRLVSTGVELLYPRLRQKLNLIIMPKAGVLKLSSGELTEILEKELKKLNLLI